MDLIKPDAKIEIVWELGLHMLDGSYINPRLALFDVCIDMDNKLNICSDDLTDQELYDKLVDYLDLPRTFILSGLESGHACIDDTRYVYEHYLSTVSQGFAPQSYKEIE
jgi:hypothetical protein